MLAVLTTNDPRWSELIARLPSHERDLHYTPEYFRVYEQTYPDRIAQNVVLENDDITIFKPFIKRRIELTDASLYDIESVYGYGGELCILSKNLSSEKIKGYLRTFQEAFATFCTESGIVSEFCLLHPLPTFQKNQQYLESEYRKEVVCADLSLPMHELWGNMEERQRKGIALAKRKGVMIKKEAADDEIIDDFQKAYLQTMDRKQAGDHWLFPDNYYKNCRDCLGTEHVSLFNAYLEGRVIATFFLIHQFDTCYYHFASNDAEFRKYNPTSLLLFETMMWAKSQGFTYYHMGGGLSKTGDDELYRFKYSFARNTFSVRQYTRIYDQKTYDKLLEISGAEAKSEWFPAYRA